MIYFLQRSDGLVKIGTTEFIHERKIQLMEKYGPVELLGLMDGSYYEESQIHTYFSDIRVVGTELFEPALKLMGYIEKHTHLDLPQKRQLIGVALDRDVIETMKILKKRYRMKNYSDALREHFKDSLPDAYQKGKRVADIMATENFIEPKDDK